MHTPVAHIARAPCIPENADPGETLGASSLEDLSQGLGSRWAVAIAHCTGLAAQYDTWASED